MCSAAATRLRRGGVRSSELGGVDPFLHADFTLELDPSSGRLPPVSGIVVVIIPIYVQTSVI